MKRLTHCLLVLAFIAGSISCNKDDNHTTAPGIGGSMSATINGGAWAAEEANLYQPASGMVEFYGLRGAATNSPAAIYLHIEAFTGPMDYPFNGGQNWASYVLDNTAYVAANGKTTVTLDNDTFFKASFVFDGHDTLGGGNTKTISGSFTYRKK